MPSSYISICLRVAKNAKEIVGVRYIKFHVSKGRFANFRKKCTLHNIKRLGESASADYTASAIFPKQLEVIPEESYLLVCVCVCVLNWCFEFNGMDKFKADF